MCLVVTLGRLCRIYVVNHECSNKVWLWDLFIYPDLCFCSWSAVYLQLSSICIPFSSVLLCLGSPFFFPFISWWTCAVQLCPSQDQGVPNHSEEKGDACSPEQHTALLNPALWSHKLKSGVEGNVIIWPLFPGGPAPVFGRGGWCWVGRGWRCCYKAG